MEFSCSSKQCQFGRKRSALQQPNCETQALCGGDVVFCAQKRRSSGRCYPRLTKGHKVSVSLSRSGNVLQKKSVSVELFGPERIISVASIDPSYTHCVVASLRP